MSAALKRPPVRLAEKVVRLQLPRKLAFLMEMHPYKVAWGGRGSLKSWSFGRALLTLGVHQPSPLTGTDPFLLIESDPASAHRFMVSGPRHLILGLA